MREKAKQKIYYTSPDLLTLIAVYNIKDAPSGWIKGNKLKSRNEELKKHIGVAMKIKSIKSIGIKKVYDVITSGKNENFILSNGVVAHNCTSVQPALRNLTEEYSEYVRFIITCNYPNRIIPAMRSRWPTIFIDKMNMMDFTEKAVNILVNENVEFDIDTLDTYIKSTYPDLRNCLLQLQLNVVNGKLKPNQVVSSSVDYQLEMVELFKTGKITEARTLLCQNAQPEEMESIYRWCYDNLDCFGKTPKQRDQAILIIKQGLVDHTVCSDPEINLAATLVRLSHNAEKS